MRVLAHAADIEPETEDLGVIANTGHYLGEAVGLTRLAANRFEVPAGKAASPLHAEDEEIFYVLAGSGWSVQEDGCFSIGAGDVVYYGAWEPAHTVVAGDDGLDFLAFGAASGPVGTTRFPRIERVRVGGLLVEGDTTHQWEIEARLERIAVSDPPDPRPATIAHVDSFPAIRFDRPPAHAVARMLSKPLGARGIALNRADLDPGGEAAPPHCHSHEEELFVVLSGDGVLLLGAEEERHPVRAGSVVGRPAGTGVAHAFRAGEQGMAMLMFSDKHPGDMAYYPRSGKVSLRGLGITIRPEIVPWGD